MKKAQTLKPRQINALQLLSMGKPVQEVAEILQVSTMTVFRWRKLPEFSSKLNSIATSGLEEIAKKMNGTVITAIETLQEALCDLSLPSPVRIKVAFGVLNAMASVNSTLEKGLKHRVADFDLQQRWSDQPFTYDATGNQITKNSVDPLLTADEIEI
ncbi:MAG: helix-turn-helix domain-containing protein [Burkholderiales bacterium]